MSEHPASTAGAALRQRFGGLRVRVVVPQWKGIIPDDSQGEPAIYAKPFTLADQKAVQSWIDTNNPEGWAQVLIRKACDEEGSRLFGMGDRPVLLEHVESRLLTDVAEQLMASTSLEGAMGNSGATRD